MSANSAIDDVSSAALGEEESSLPVIASSSSPAELPAIGTVVELHSLKTTAHRNGERGVVAALGDDGRLEVQMDEGDRVRVASERVCVTSPTEPYRPAARYLQAKEHVMRGTQLATNKNYAEALPLFSWVVLSGYPTLAATIRLDLMADTVHDRIRKQPNDFDTAALYAYFLSAKLPKDGIEALSTPIEKAPKPLSPRDTPRVSALLRMRGWFHAITGDAAAAHGDLDRAVELDPANLPALYLRSKVARHLRRRDAALADLRLYLERAPRDEYNLPQAYYESALLEAGGRPKDAALLADLQPLVEKGDEIAAEHHIVYKLPPESSYPDYRRAHQALRMLQAGIK